MKQEKYRPQGFKTYLPFVPGMKVEYQGVTDTITAHARRLGLPPDLSVDRARKYGVSPEALQWNFSPDSHIRRYEYQGIVATISGHAKRLGICETVCLNRARALGVSPETLPRIFAPVFVWPKIVYRGIADTVAGHARRCGLEPKLCNRRASIHGLRPENYDRIFAPVRGGILFHGIRDTYRGHARRAGLCRTTITRRLKRFGSSPEALEKVFRPSKPIVYEYGGVKDTLQGHARRLGIGWQTVLHRRMAHGESAETLPLLLAPLERQWHWVTYEGVRDTLKGHAARLGISYAAILQRAHRYGLSEDVLPLVFSKREIEPRRRTYTCNGITDTSTGWARRLGLTGEGVRKRLTLAPPEVALSYPRLKQYGKIEDFERSKEILTFRGETHTPGGWARITGLSRSTIRARIRKGLPPEKVLSRTEFRVQVEQRRHSPRRCDLAALGLVV